MVNYLLQFIVGYLFTSILILKLPFILVTSNKNDFSCNHQTWKTILLQQCDLNADKPPCPPKHFHVPGMTYCHPWLTCEDLNHVVLKEVIGYGAVKAVYRAEWQGVNIAISLLNNDLFKDDFQHGIEMLKALNPNKYVIQLIGYCSDSIMLTEYHKLGNALNLLSVLETKKEDNVILRMNLCLNYAHLLNYLHNSPVGTRVFCDSNNLTKLLSQLLITDTLMLVLNDVDALAVVSESNNYLIKCGHSEIIGSFVAPEQRWPFTSPFVDHEMPGYNEKTDIWKAPAVCEHFISNVDNKDVLQYYIFGLHKECRNADSTRRPPASRLVTEYLSIIDELSKYYQYPTN